MREKSDPRTTVDKLQSICDWLIQVEVDLDELNRLKHCVHEPDNQDLTAETPNRLTFEETLTHLSESLKDICVTVDNVKEEVEIMAKCQYEMRKTIKAKTYAPAEPE